MQRIRNNLYLRNKSYYCRVQIPREFQKLLGRKDVWKSLKTSHFALAKLKVNEVITSLLVQFNMSEQGKIKLGIWLKKNRVINYQKLLLKPLGVNL